MKLITQQRLSTTTGILAGLFFILVLHIKASYTLIPLLLSLVGLGVWITQRKQHSFTINRAERLLSLSFISYFLLFVLSLAIHQGRGSELDLPSRLVLLLPLLLLFSYLSINITRLLYMMIIGTLLAGVVALVQFFILMQPNLFPAHMYIQAGDIVMTLSLCSLAIALYFYQHKQHWGFVLALIATLLGLVACLLNQARGAWVIAPFCIPLLLVLYRHLLSKRMALLLFTMPLLAVLFGGNLIEKRVEQATQEINRYIEYNDGSTSVGARLDMWKSALIGIQEKPVFGWGLQGIKTMREQHHKEGLISEFAASFDHAHNQYLHDTTARGLFGLIALLAIFLVPLGLFWRNLKQVQRNSLSYLWGTLGIIHIVATMGYCLTQAFLSHNSGMMFYGFCTLLFYALQKMSLNRPLVGTV